MYECFISMQSSCLKLLFFIKRTIHEIRVGVIDKCTVALTVIEETQLEAGQKTKRTETWLEVEMEAEIETEAGTQQAKEDSVLFALSQILSKPHTSQLTRNSTSMSVPASSAQIPTGHAHSVNRSGGVIALSHSDFSPNT
ncbi:hypothetical protein BD560DRAFT_423477 [Blakeslea trispora]|nr:hypothetical protein BD560DRAFT_423477 [Blakeslea trispora]